MGYFYHSNRKRLEGAGCSQAVPGGLCGLRAPVVLTGHRLPLPGWKNQGRHLSTPGCSASSGPTAACFCLRLSQIPLLPSLFLLPHLFLPFSLKLGKIKQRGRDVWQLGPSSRLLETSLSSAQKARIHESDCGLISPKPLCSASWSMFSVHVFSLAS